MTFQLEHTRNFYDLLQGTGMSVLGLSSRALGTVITKSREGEKNPSLYWICSLADLTLQREESLFLQQNFHLKSCHIARSPQFFPKKQINRELCLVALFTRLERININILVLRLKVRKFSSDKIPQKFILIYI